MQGPLCPIVSFVSLFCPAVITNEKTSKEKCDSMRAYGGEVIIGPSGVPADHPDHYQNMAVTLCKDNAGYFDVDQYDNPNNPEAYYRTLGPEVRGSVELELINGGNRVCQGIGLGIQPSVRHNAGCCLPRFHRHDALP